MKSAPPLNEPDDHQSLGTTVNGTTHSSRLRIGILLLLVAASAEFLARAPFRMIGASGWNDFLSPYIQTRAWISGMDPYSTENFVRFWPPDNSRMDFITRDAEDGSLVAKHGVPSPYPITTFVILAPLTVLPWSLAQPFWVIVSLSAFAFVICALVTLAGVKWRDPRAQLFLALCLAFAPFHTGLATENLVVPVLGLCVAAMWAEHRRLERFAGFLLAVAICLKPHVGLCFLTFYVVRRRWKVATVASTCIVVVTMAAIGRLSINGIPWFPTYVQDSQKILAPGAINDFTSANPVWFNMINLQVLLYRIAGNARLANIFALLVVGLFLCLWLWLVTKIAPSGELLALSTLATLSLLPVYHRFYDAALLVLSLSWVLLIPRLRQKPIAIVSLVPMLVFLFPGAAFLDQLAERGHVSRSILNSTWWNVLVMPHQVWALLSLSVLLLFAMHAEKECGVGAAPRIGASSAPSSGASQLLPSKRGLLSAFSWLGLRVILCK